MQTQQKSQRYFQAGVMGCFSTKAEVKSDLLSPAGD